MTDVTIPSRLSELLDSTSGFQVVSEWNPCDFTDDEIKNHFDDFAGITTSDGGLDQLSQDTVDVLYNLITNFRSMTDENKELFAVSMTELSAQAIESIGEQLSAPKRNARKQVVYFLIEFLKINEDLAKEENSELQKVATQNGMKAAAKGKSKKSDSSYSWLEWRHTCLKLIFQAACSEPSHLWNMGLVQDNYLRGMWVSSLTMLCNRPNGVGGPGVLESTMRGLCVAIITRCATLFGNSSSGGLGAVSSALLDAVIKNEHMANFVAEICSKSRNTSLCRELLWSISRLQLTHTSEGVKNIGSFIEALARISPDVMSQHLATLKSQIDSPAYMIRSSLLHAMGSVISYIHKASEEKIGTGTAEGESDKKGGEGDEEGEEEGEKEVTPPENEEDEDEEEKEVEEKEGDDSDRDRNISQLIRVRDSLLDLLTERTHDVTYFTRAVALKVESDKMRFSYIRWLIHDVHVFRFC